MIPNGNRYRITLPSFPNQWNDIPTDKLEEILRLMAMRQGEIVTKGEEVADRLYRLRVLLCLLDMKIVRRTVSDEDGETVFIFRRKGIRHIFERIPMRAWQINQWIDSRLKFLDRPTALLKSPYPYVSLRRGKLKLRGPANMLGDVTFQQYLVAQNTLTSYWNIIKKMEEEDGRNHTHQSRTQDTAATAETGIRTSLPFPCNLVLPLGDRDRQNTGRTFHPHSKTQDMGIRHESDGKQRTLFPQSGRQDIPCNGTILSERAGSLLASVSRSLHTVRQRQESNEPDSAGSEYGELHYEGAGICLSRRCLQKPGSPDT